MVIPPGVEPGLPPWKGDVLTSWPRDHIYKAQLRIFLYPKNINLIIKILLYVPLWSLVSLGRFELPVHWLKVSCVTSYATGSDILDGCFAANKHYHRLIMGGFYYDCAPPYTKTPNVDWAHTIANLPYARADNYFWCWWLTLPELASTTHYISYPKKCSQTKRFFRLLFHARVFSHEVSGIYLFQQIIANLPSTRATHLIC